MQPTSQPVSRRGVVAVVVRDGRFLVIKRSRFVIAPGAMCFPGGGMEAGESEEETLVREFQEELGAASRPLRRIWTTVTRWHVELAWWQAELHPDVELLPNPAEVAGVEWLTAEAMLAHPQLLESNHDFLRAHSRGEFTLE